LVPIPRQEVKTEAEGKSSVNKQHGDVKKSNTVKPELDVVEYEEDFDSSDDSGQ